MTGSILRLSVAAALPLLAMSFIAGARAAPPARFDALPLVQPGQLQGRLVYLSRTDCELRQFDLATGKDSAAGSSGLCASGSYPVLAPDGTLVAERTAAGMVELVNASGTRRLLGPALTRAPMGFRFPPEFSPDSRQIAFCTGTGGRLVTLIADTRTGRIIGREGLSCDVAFTRSGLAISRGGRVMLAGKTIFVPRKARLASGIGSPIATNPRGTLLAVATRPISGRRSSRILQIHVLTLGGREIARYQALEKVPTSLVQLSPRGHSAVVWWGCIRQLAAFDRGRGSFRFRYGSAGEPILRTAYSPDGRYAVMGRDAFGPPRSPPPPPKDVVVLDGHTFDGRYRVPIGARVLTWLR